MDKINMDKAGIDETNMDETNMDESNKGKKKMNKENMDKGQIKIAFIGTGFMGEPMAFRLLDAGYQLVVYNRTISKTTDLQKRGASVAKLAQDAVEQADVSIIMLTGYPAIYETLFEDPGMYNLWKGKTHIQMSTISPVESLLLKDYVEKSGGNYLEAPVLGSIPQVKAGQLLVFGSGSQSLFEKWHDLFACFSNNRIFIGETGQATALKLALNQLAFMQTAAFSMSLGYLRETGVNTDLFMDILRNTGIYSKGLERKADAFLKRDYSNTRFPLNLMLKDISLMVEQFQNAGIDVAPLQGAQRVIKKGVDKGNGLRDGLSVYDVFHPENDK
ncbi:MAG: NAD(P)-dependent oxidoreductase [bacterium]|nr:NAD(P)-dependent oxidoreductase [bacterium]